MLSPVELDRHRPNLTGHCYRMLGSVFDADDAVQETLVRAWRHQDRFEERAALGSWLHRIATNVCLDLLADRKRRARPIEEGPAGKVGDTLHQRPAEEWLEPIPDAAVCSPDIDPHERLVLKERTRLAFVSALQHLPGKQRAALLLTEVVGCSAAEAAECLEMTLPALNSALQRARAKLGDLDTSSGPLTDTQARLLERYVTTFEAYDVDGLTSLMHEDATLSMPPFCLWLSGPDEIHRWLLGPGAGCRGSRLVATEACGSPAFAQYRSAPQGGHAAWALIVLELSEERITGWNAFLDVERLFPRFSLPLVLA
ncbi:MAG: sigma-70 family RNA polymerase sigma factor [Polyangiaceae bacterium]|nr:sigma-70 family RNA polymerase sigma factor [Polyangiaceae bacterium]